MAGPVTVSDPADPRLADYVGLRDPDLRRRLEPGRGIFVAEGVTTIRALLSSPYATRSVLVTPARHEELRADLATCAAPVFVAPREVLRAVVGFDLHRGAVAAGERHPAPPVDLAAAARVAYLEGVNDHENLGALFRNAAAFGLDAIALDPTCADPLYRRSIRVSMGHVLHVPFTRVEGIGVLHDAGLTTVALTPSLDATPVGQIAVPPRHAFLLGAEGPGLRPETLAAAHHRVRIPIRDGVDSLNVATAAAVAFHVLRGAGVTDVR